MTDIPDDEQKILAEMPLHAITAVYGEQGLRARLAIETGRLDDAAGRQKISEALELAGRLHAADRRQREPYINHYADLRIMPVSRGERAGSGLTGGWKVGIIRGLPKRRAAGRVDGTGPAGSWPAWSWRVLSL